MRAHVTTALVCLALVAPGRAAHAEEVAEKVVELVTQAQEAYAEDDYAKSIELLTEAYALYPDPAIRYNMARAYEAHGDCEKARWAFSDVIDDQNADPDVRTTAQDGLRTMTCKEEGVALTPASEPSNPLHIPGWATWTCVGLGAVSMAMGGVLNAVSYDTHDELSTLGRSGDNKTEYDDVRAQLKGEILASRVFYGTGAVLVGAGLLALLVSEDEQPISILAAPGTLGLQAHTSW
jgi:hypothetical protein